MFWIWMYLARGIQFLNPARSPARARQAPRTPSAPGMLLPKEHLDEIFRRIREDAVAGCCTVLILVAPDCDALCACRILTVRRCGTRRAFLLGLIHSIPSQTLLRCDNVAYKIKPVASYEDIAHANAQLLVPNDEVRGGRGRLPGLAPAHRARPSHPPRRSSRLCF